MMSQIIVGYLVHPIGYISRYLLNRCIYMNDKGCNRPGLKEKKIESWMSSVALTGPHQIQSGPHSTS